MFNTLISTIAIVATSTKNTDTEMAGNGFNEFTHNGKTCRFGRVEGGIASSLIVEYPKYDMYIVLVGRPIMSKEELLGISDMLNF